MAVKYRDGYGVHALNGVRVDPWMAETPYEQLDASKIITIKNVVQRREVLRRLGIPRLLQQTQAQIVDEKSIMIGDNVRCPYVLLVLNLGSGFERCHYLHFPDATMLRQYGKKEMLLEGVPNECDTVEKALNWRNPWSEKVGQLPKEVS